MSQIIIPPVDVLLQGNLAFSKGSNPGSITLPVNSVGDAQIPSGANVNPAKLATVPLAKEYSQSPGAAGSGTSVVADTKDIHIANPSVPTNGGLIVGVQAALTGALPTSTATVNVDVQKSTAGGAFASVLTGVIALNAGSTIRVAVAGALTVTTYSASDLFRFVITLTGSGTVAQGLSVSLRLQEPVG